MQKNEVMDGEDGPILGQGQYGIVYVTRDVKQPFFKTGQKNHVEENREDASAGKWQFHFSNLIKNSFVFAFARVNSFQLHKHIMLLDRNSTLIR